MPRLLLLPLLLVLAPLLRAQPLVYEGAAGLGRGKHIVFLAGDHEYRSEETLPALARILALHHGFKCTVLFSVHPATGEIDPAASNLPGMEALATADLAVVFLRFQAPPVEQLRHLEAYLARGGPVVGLRTATHAFRTPADHPLAKFSYDSKVPGYELGFGHQVLGQTWVGHLGRNHAQSTRITIVPERAGHPILRGVKDIWAHVGAYVGKPVDGEVLTLAQPLNGMTPDSPPDATKAAQPSEWTRTYRGASGRTGRVFTSLYGTPEDLLNEGYRRLLVNGCLWAAGLEDTIRPDLAIGFVGPFRPNTHRNLGHARGVKPAQYAGFTSPIPANNDTGPAPKAAPKKEAPKKAAAETPKAEPKADAKAAPKTAAKTAPKAAAKAPPPPPREPDLFPVPPGHRDPLPFAFRPGEVVALLGNALPERMQHDGWLETLLQSRLAGQNVRFRNMSTSGDRPNTYPRSKGQLHMTEYLRHVQADVVFAFFGYNESFAGVDQADAHRRDLLEFVARTRGSRANGRDFPRIVLFSPTAFEDTRNPLLPDGREHNARLKAYADATAAAAREAGVAYVDLFTPTLELFRQARTPLTLNGVHFTAEGNRLLAEVIARALLGQAVPAAPALQPLREAVLDKDEHWHARYRARDGNDVWGGRSTLAFVDGQTNATVLQHELKMLDVMTANRDARVWARATGGDLTVDDRNVPPPIPVKTNIGGGSASSSAMKEGLPRYISGEDGLRHLALADGFAANVFAAEDRFPGLINPVQLQVDARGRLWAAVWPTYPMWQPLQPMRDALLIFHDDDGDGRADRTTEFARIQNPLGFEFWNGGVLVASGPDLVFLKDTNGDDVADVREIVLHGLDTADTHHGANNLILGPDGGLYWQSGIFMVHNHENPWGPSLRSEASAMFRFDPRTYRVAFHAANSPNPHGIAFDGWGYHYATDGTGGRAFQVRPHEQGFKMFELLKKEVRPVAACEIVSSTHFPDAMQGDFLICNVIGFRGIKQYRLARDAAAGTVWGEPSGAPLKVKVPQADGTEVEETSAGLLMSGDKNFRPADAIFGADGALYVADWHNVIIGHMQHNVRDPQRDQRHGRIYRVTAAGRPLQAAVAIAGQPIEALLENLLHPTDGVRHRTRVELSGRDSRAVIAATRRWMARFDPARREHARPLLEALWLHQQHHAPAPELLAQLLASPEPHARVAAATVNHFLNPPAAKPAAAQAAHSGHAGHGAAPAAATPAPAVKSGVVRETADLVEIRIGTVVEAMRYDITKLTVPAGKRVRLTFFNPDAMPHNWLLVRPGKADAVGEAAVALGARGFELNWVPPGGDVLAATKLVDHNREEVLEFTAPATPGDYPYVCSFPGHHLLMRGVLTVR